MYKKIFLTYFYLTCIFTAYSQHQNLLQSSEINNELTYFQHKSHPNDTLHSPKKAAVLSAVLPGLGQAYNKKYWKIPIIYLGLGLSGWFIYNNHYNYKLFKNEYVYRINNNSQTQNEELSGFSQDQLRILLDQYHRWRDFSIAAAVAIYSLNIIDALVDGYLWRFDTNDKDLSFKPSLGFDNTLSFYPSITLKYNFTNSLYKKKHEYCSIRLR